MAATRYMSFLVVSDLRGTAPEELYRVVKEKCPNLHFQIVPLPGVEEKPNLHEMCVTGKPLERLCEITDVVKGELFESWLKTCCGYNPLSDASTNYFLVDIRGELDGLVAALQTFVGITNERITDPRWYLEETKEKVRRELMEIRRERRREGLRRRERFGGYSDLDERTEMLLDDGV